MNLPGMYTVRLTQDVRIAVGKKSDKGYPEKLDHFILTRWDAGKKRYVQDAEAMTLLQEYVGGEGKVVRLPVSVLGNLVEVPDEMRPGRTRLEVPESVLWTRMAYYSGKQAVCACDNFRLKMQGEAAADDLVYPLDPNARASWCGDARRREYVEGKLKAEHPQPCNPYVCPYATGEHKHEKHAGVALCKPQAILTVQLQWMPRLGVVAKFVTTSWQSVAKIRGSLIGIGAENRGWLALLPLWLVVSMETVSKDGWTAPIVHVEYEGNRKELTAQTLDLVGQLGDIQDGLARIESGSVKALDAGEDAEAFASEFAHDTAEDVPTEAFGSGVAAYCRGMADELSWTEGQWDARVKGIEDDTAEWERLAEELEGLTGRTIEPTPEPEKLDVAEGEAPAEEAAPDEADPFHDAPDREPAEVNGDGQAGMDLPTGGGHRDD